MNTTILSEKNIGKLTLKNRLIVSPMQQWQGTPESFATDYHVQHYAKLASGAGLLIIESTKRFPEWAAFSQ